MTTSAAWETFAHASDVGVRGRGATLERAFENAALALTSVVTDPARVAARESVRIECEAPDLELLLVDWLNAIVYAMSARGMLFSRFRLELDGTRLSGEAWGEPLEAARHEPAAEVKAATLSGLEVSRGEGGTWTAQCVVDV